MKILFATAHFGFLRNFESGLRELAQRGHQIHLLADRRDSLGGMRTVERLAEGHPTAFTWSIVPSPKTFPWRTLGTSFRLCLDYWRYLDPEYDHAPALRGRAASQVPRFLAPLARFPLARIRLVRAGLARVVKAVERIVPPSPHVDSVLDDIAPDVLVVTPLLYFGSQQVDYVRAAGHRGIPTMLGVGSWDHLTTKGLIHGIPDVVTVWNEAQRSEAARFHGVPPERVTVTGSTAYDHWFDAQPSLTRGEFCASVGVDPDRPLLLYLCSSPFIAPHEVGFVQRWIEGIRSSPDERLRTSSILIRPHPQNAGQWKDVNVSTSPNVAIWPRAGANPVDRDARSDYYHSMLFSAAVVGVNTSALIESGIIGRPVYTIRDPEFAGTQDGTLHFQHLKTVKGGLLTVAASLEEHCRQLAGFLANPDGTTRKGRAFIEAFIRPHGLDIPASGLFADAVERLGWSGRRPPKTASALTGLLRSMLYPAALVAQKAANRTSRKAQVDGDVTRQRRILFVMGSPEYLRFFDGTIRHLACTGNTVLLAVNAQRDVKQVRVQDFGRETPGVEFVGVVPNRDDMWAGFADAVRGTMDFVRYLDPRFSDVPVLRARMKRKCLPRVLHWIDRVRSLSQAHVVRVLWLLSLMERGIPVSSRVKAFVQACEPDAVLVTPLVDAASDQVDTVRAASDLGVPTGACIASWDNLTNKGLLRVRPNLVTVWNEIQATEAVEFHGMDRDRVVVTGAQPFDRWFESQPSRTREEFCAALGFEPTRPLVLFTGSSFFISGEWTEVPFVRKWLQALRECDDVSLRGANVLVRPHPYNAAQWERAELSDLGPVAIWPKGRHNPTDEQNRSDFFDSLFYCGAVVGINTSAMIEAAIVGRPVHAILTPDFAGTQEGTIHFRYLLPENGGFLRVGRTLDAHIHELARSLEDRAGVQVETQRFVASFIRPFGRDRASMPALATAVQNLADSGNRVRPRTDWAGLLMRPIALIPAVLFATQAYVYKGTKGSQPIRKRLRTSVHRAKKRAHKAMARTRELVTRGPRNLRQRLRRSKSRTTDREQAVARMRRPDGQAVPPPGRESSGL